MREFAKNRGNDFASYANLGGKAEIDTRELDALVRACGDREDLNANDMRNLALLESERLYRVCCVLAYGSNPTGSGRKANKRTHERMLGAVSDIEPFAKAIPKRDISLDDAAESQAWHELTYWVKLPYNKRLLGEYPKSLRTPTRYHSSLNPVEYLFSHVQQEVSDSGASQTFTLHSYNHEANPEFMHEPFRVLAQTIINARVAPNLVGIFNGKPLFESEYVIDSLWQTLAELSEGQAPGICPVCGRIVDRRRGVSGGHPPVACKHHINKFHNDLKKAVKHSENHDPREMAYSDRCELAVRALRWKERPELNERQLCFDQTSFL